MDVHMRSTCSTWALRKGTLRPGSHSCYKSRLSCLSIFVNRSQGIWHFGGQSFGLLSPLQKRRGCQYNFQLIKISLRDHAVIMRVENGVQGSVRASITHPLSLLISLDPYLVSVLSFNNRTKLVTRYIYISEELSDVLQ